MSEEIDALLSMLGGKEQTSEADKPSGVKPDSNSAEDKSAKPKGDDKSKAKVDPAAAAVDEPKFENEPDVDGDEEEADSDESEEKSAWAEEREAFIARIDQLTKVIEKAQITPKIEQKLDESIEDVVIEAQDFVTELDFDDPDSIKKSINNGIRRAVELGAKKAIEVAGTTFTKRNLPAIQGMINQSVTIATTVSEFYRNNPDLIPFKKVVGLEVTEVREKEPNLSIAELLEKSGEAVRQKLRLAKAKGAENNDPIKFPKSHAPRQKAETSTKGKNPMKDQIMEIIKHNIGE